ncbi:succinate dehydrogenase subunit D [Poseidonocella pacifica]|uniref:Succinate dehydrogenase hydrophobic membrane anchor subunit n=1 Tax=Poseidonocella pacifica TaxID=871651 RepID=A0A1I0YX99_9RHOB|nr:succinate dehydrogenase, hydrophobic membrane anchor protein [Poseidonocella pacifica]SFB17802.1 succinate dehydrogenase subunit D [Poseidonocella pacifica]
MRFLTDRKRAVGLGAAKSGVEHFWAMKVSSVALLFLVPLFVITFGRTLGADYEAVQAYYARPFPAIVAALTLVVGFKHFNDGVQVLIEDYVHGIAQKIALIAMTCISYAAAATGVFAIAKLAL